MCCTAVACRSAWTIKRQRRGGNSHDGALDVQHWRLLGPEHLLKLWSTDATGQVETLEVGPQRASALAASRRKCAETCRRLVLETHLCISIPSTFEALAHSTSQRHDRWTGTKKKFQPMKVRPIAGVTCGGVRWSAVAMYWLMVQRCSSQASFVNTVSRSDSAFVELKSVTRYCPFFVDDIPTQEREISSLKVRGSRLDVFFAAVRKPRDHFLTVATVSSK